MPQPHPYVRVANYSSSLGATGVSLDADLDAIKTTLDAIEANIKITQRDDGALTNQSVSQDTLTALVLQLMAGWKPKGPWAAQTFYAVGDFVSNAGLNYVCFTPHISDLVFDASKFTVAGGGGTVTAGLINQLAYFAASGATVSGLPTANSGLLVTSGAGVPSIATAIPNGVTATTQAATDASTLIATMAALATATGKVKIQVFDIGGGASQTYTPSTGMVNALGITWGGGGGGGGSASSNAGVGTSGAGGGAGSLSIKLMTAAQVGVSKTVTLGAAGTAGASGNNAGGPGGDTSIGSLCIGKGGSGGAGNAGGAGQLAVAGAGGVAGTGDITGTGQPGQPGGYYSGGFPAGGMAGGGSSLIDGGAPTNTFNTVGAVGVAGTGRASGGSGGITNSANAAIAGGAGTAGHAFIIEFCNQG
jgi:hypothetical protein